MTTLDELQIPSLGECSYPSPLAKYISGRRTNEHYVDEDDRVLYDDTVSLLEQRDLPLAQLPAFEPGGPRRQLFFPPGGTRVGIVTCGGLCPGLNDVIRGLVVELADHYGIHDVLGFRYGYAGLVSGLTPDPIALTTENVALIPDQGGTMLGTSRGGQDPAAMADRLAELGVDILFVIGGDGSMRGAASVADELNRRGVEVGVIGVPKTIDNDIPYIGQSFGFQTSFTVAADVITTARVEAQAALNGIGLVKLMGRHSGFIACYAALASRHADAVLIPEVPFTLEKFLPYLRERVADRGQAVVVVAEGAGQDLLPAATTTDASGNTKLGDIGSFLKGAIEADFASTGMDLTLKYFDPGYQIRSVPARAADSVYCVRLAQAAVHAGMAGRTGMVVGRRHNRFIHVPISLAVSARNQVAPDGDLWLSVLEGTAQPTEML